MGDGATGPLAGLRVLAIEHSVAGPLSTRILAELGADVVKIERPGSGDFSRHWDHNVHGEGAQFWWLNRGKRSAAIDLKSVFGKQALGALLSQFDVLVHNLAPASAKRLGLDGETLQEQHPGLINCQISGYGAEGPGSDRKAYDMLVQAEVGVMSLTGTPEQPTRVGVSISDVTTGIYAALLVLAAVHERSETGRGRHLDIAMFDVTLEFLGPMLLSYLNAGVTYPRVPDHHHAIAPYGVFTCQDGVQILIAIEQDSEWQRFCRSVLGDDQLAQAPEYLTNVSRLVHREPLQTAIASKIGEVPSTDMLASLAKANLAYARVNDILQVAEHPVVADRQIVRAAMTERGHPALRLSGIAERLFGTANGGRDRPPALGEDTESVLRELTGTASSQGGISHEGQW